MEKKIFVFYVHPIHILLAPILLRIPRPLRDRRIPSDIRTLDTANFLRGSRRTASPRCIVDSPTGRGERRRRMRTLWTTLARRNLRGHFGDGSDAPASSLSKSVQGSKSGRKKFCSGADLRYTGSLHRYKFSGVGSCNGKNL